MEDVYESPGDHVQERDTVKLDVRSGSGGDLIQPGALCWSVKIYVRVHDHVRGKFRHPTYLLTIKRAIIIIHPAGSVPPQRLHRESKSGFIIKMKSAFEIDLVPIYFETNGPIMSDRCTQVASLVIKTKGYFSDPIVILCHYTYVASNDASSPTRILYVVLAYSSARPESSQAPIARRADRTCRSVSTK